MSHLNTFTNQPVIRREQTYVLDRKLVSIHSEDRDVRKWKNSNKFEVRLPEAIKNVQSMRLINISVPNNLYTFTNSYQNTKLTFKITPSNYAVANNNVENKLNVNKTNNYTITIDEGVYTNEQMANMLANKMNETVTTFLKGDQTAELGGSALVVDYNYTHFVVKYNEVKRLFVFAIVLIAFQSPVIVRLNIILQIVSRKSCGTNTQNGDYLFTWDLKKRLLLLLY